MAYRLPSPILRGLTKPSIVVALAPIVENPFLHDLWMNASMRIASEAATKEIAANKRLNLPEVVVSEPSLHFLSLGNLFAELKSKDVTMVPDRYMRRFLQLYPPHVVGDIFGRGFLVAADQVDQYRSRGLDFPEKVRWRFHLAFQWSNSFSYSCGSTFVADSKHCGSF